MSTHYICFHGKIRKVSLITRWKRVLTGAMQIIAKHDLTMHDNNLILATVITLNN